MHFTGHQIGDLAPVFELVMDQLLDGILLVDNSLRKVVYCNHKFSTMWKIPLHILENGDDFELIEYVVSQLSNPSEFRDSIAKMYETNDVLQDQIHFIDSRVFSRKSFPIRCASGPNLRVWLFSEISQHNLDPITGCLNREAWDQYLLSQSDRAQDCFLCVIVADINDFKTINNDCGSQEADRLLFRISESLNRLVRSEADKLFRTGGDEFCLIIHASHDICDDITVQLRQELLASGINAAFGVCMTSSRVALLDAFKNALRYMMHSKKQHKQSAISLHPHFPLASAKTKTDADIALHADLSVAVSKGELSLAYQPIFNQLDHIEWLEVLCRWEHNGQQVPPSVFIPLAESSDLIHRIWDHVLTTAVSSISQWQNAGLEIKPLSLNFSAVQVEYYINTGFSYSSQISQLCQEYGVSPEYLKIELTETSLLTDLAQAKELFSELADLGVDLCIDDFGTGYSSLAVLQSLPIKYLKIDGAFIDAIPANRENTAIVKGAILMARELGLKVVAECVQGNSQIDFLASHGCHYFQGFFKSAPLPFADASEALKS